MKKTMVGAVALSAALVLGCATPAFAEVSASGDTAFDQAAGAATGDQTTVVQLEATTTQINATVPVTVVVSAKIEGGKMITPSAGAYKIVNNSTAGSLYVTSAAGTLVAGEWSDAASTDAAADTAAPRPEGDTAKYGSVVVTLTSGALGEADVDTGVVELGTTTNEPITLAGLTKTDIKAESPWVIEKATVADGATKGTELGLKLAARGSALADLTTASDAVKLMDIVYTVTMVNPNAATA